MRKHFVVYASTNRNRRNKKLARSAGRNKRIMASSLDDGSKQLRAITNYLPPTGEGSTMASQVATAVMKLVFRWFNDGDVYDNTYGLEGWANDLSSYANWLYKYTAKSVWGPTRVRDILEQIYDCGSSEDAYENILEQLVDALSDDEDLENWAKQPKQGSVYRCDGPFRFEEISDEDEDYDDYEENYDDEEDEDY